MNNKAFTLVELLISMSIFSIVAIAMGAFFLISAQGQRNLIARQNLADNLRFAIEAMARQLRLAQVDVDGDCTGIAADSTYLSSTPSDIRFMNHEGDCILYSLVNSKINVIRTDASDPALEVVGDLQGLNIAGVGSESQAENMLENIENIIDSSGLTGGQQNQIENMVENAEDAVEDASNAAEMRDILNNLIEDIVDFIVETSDVTADEVIINRLEFIISGELVSDSSQPRVTIVIEAETAGSRPEDNLNIRLQTTVSARNVDSL